MFMGSPVTEEEVGLQSEGTNNLYGARCVSSLGGVGAGGRLLGA